MGDVRDADIPVTVFAAVQLEVSVEDSDSLATS